MTIQDLRIGESDFIANGVHFRILAASSSGEYTVLNVATGLRKEGVKLLGIQIERYTGENTLHRELVTAGRSKVSNNNLHDRGQYAIPSGRS